MVADHVVGMTVEPPSTDPSQRPCADMSPSTHPQSPCTLLPSSSPCALSAFQDTSVPQQLDNLHQNSIMEVEIDTPTPYSDPLDDICAQVPQHILVLFLTTAQENHLSQSLATGLKDLFLDHADTFATGPTDIGYCDLLQHDIDTSDIFPIKQSPRRPPLAARHAEDDILDEMLESGVIEPSDSPWASPVCLVKKDGTFRFCVDYRQVNSVSRRDAFPIPDIHDALGHLRGCRYFATIDVLSGYLQLGMTDRAKERSAFAHIAGFFNSSRPNACYLSLTLSS